MSMTTNSETTGSNAAQFSGWNLGSSQVSDGAALGLSPNSYQEFLRIIGQLADLLNQLASTPTTDYRSLDGTGNNLENPEWGSSGTSLGRTMDHGYYDGSGTDIAGIDRPNPRDVSNAVGDQTELTANAKGASDLFWQWGQFIDHDITLVEHSGDDTQSISVPTGDPEFDPFSTGTAEIPLTRSDFEWVDGVKQQTNAISSYIDASMIYGSDQETADSLRSFEGGRMRVDASGLMPSDEMGMFEAGEVRANEQSGLTAMHTLWVREHNYWADRLSAENPSWSDEKIYQEAREMVTAEVQHITYNEFLPTMLGTDALGQYEGYDSSVNAGISNEFSTAAFRFGHTMLSPTIPRLDENAETIAEGDLSLADAFFQPDTVREAGIDPIIRGQAEQVAQALDPMVIDDVRNTLFGAPGSGGLDLVALNIQRGRDHGLPSWNDAREAVGLERIESFDDPIFIDGFGDKLASVYDNPDDVDLWVGGLAENPAGDSLVGETFSKIITDQFERLRSGDRYWYEATLTQNELAEVKSTSLSDIIERNTDVDMADDTAMIATDSPTNGYVPKSDSGLQDLLTQLTDILRQISSQLDQPRYS